MTPDLAARCVRCGADPARGYGLIVGRRYCQSDTADDCIDHAPVERLIGMIRDHRAPPAVLEHADGTETQTTAPSSSEWIIVPTITTGRPDGERRYRRVPPGPDGLDRYRETLDEPRPPTRPD